MGFSIYSVMFVLLFIFSSISLFFTVRYLLIMFANIRPERQHWFWVSGPLCFFIPMLYNEKGNSARNKFSAAIVASLISLGLGVYIGELESTI